MRLTEEQSSQVIRHLERQQMEHCRICRSQSWAVGETVFEMTEFHQSVEAAGSAENLRMPVVTVTCRSCGHMLLFNALMLGLVGS